MAKRKSNPVLRTSACACCGDLFEYTYTMGCPRRHCGPKCKSRHGRDLTAIRKRHLGGCTAPDCDGVATRVGFGLCEKHYTRMRRCGSLADRPKPPARMQSHGYVIERANHPLSVKGGVYQHRRVAYDANNGACPNCHWCDVPLEWAECHVDHLNGAKADNRPANLVVACSGCNRSRGAAWPFLSGLTASGRESLLATLGWAGRGGAFSIQEASSR